MNDNRSHGAVHALRVGQVADKACPHALGYNMRQRGNTDVHNTMYHDNISSTGPWTPNHSRFMPVGSHTRRRYNQ